jgi:hypothetical protein
MPKCLTEVPDTYFKFTELIYNTEESIRLNYLEKSVSCINPFTDIEYCVERRLYMDADGNGRSVEWFVGPHVFSRGVDAYTYWTRLCLSM